ncbi:MAG TPA: cytochrome c oxidase subunit 3 [Verrucomicrobiae bacterium]|jgi:cytochrome c oxidase subunit 3|nr:cytochrome c oxidase subunit 3 [Verrucomicrobiae bacterium]
MDIPYTVERREDTGLYNAKLGVWLFLASEVMLFGALFSSYILLRVGAEPGTWPRHWLDYKLGALNTIVLIISSVTNVVAWANLKLGQFNKYRFYQAITIVCAFVFLAIKTNEYVGKFHHYTVVTKEGKIADGHLLQKTADKVVLHGYWAKDMDEVMDPKGPENASEIEIEKSDILEMKNYGPARNNFTGLYFTMTGLHVLHIIGGIIVIIAIWGPLSGMHKTDPERYANRVEVAGLFWSFVDLVWLFIFPTLYLL